MLRPRSLVTILLSRGGISQKKVTPQKLSSRKVLVETCLVGEVGCLRREVVQELHHVEGQDEVFHDRSLRAGPAMFVSPPPQRGIRRNR